MVAQSASAWCVGAPSRKGTLGLSMGWVLNWLTGYQNGGRPLNPNRLILFKYRPLVIVRCPVLEALLYFSNGRFSVSFSDIHLEFLNTSISWAREFLLQAHIF